MSQPNIVIILADDLGYGDLSCLNPEGKFETPHLDGLAAGGMTFTDTHSTSAVCTPSRYGLLTGRYCWRSRLKSGIVWDWDSPLLEEGRRTVANLLQDAGYRTACIGKWHLGWDWTTVDGTSAGEELPFGAMDQPPRRAMDARIDWSARIGDGPVDRGFDSYFGVDVPNFPPYTWFENDHLSETPTEPKAEHLYGHEGPSIPGWSHEAMLPAFADKAVEFINEASAGEQPFFHYLPLTSPHSPVVPNDAFKGKSGIGSYGDFVQESDWVVGQVRQALEANGQLDNTLLIFTSDNGPERGMKDDDGVYNRLQRCGHASMGPWRGIKRDAWEGGHRIPFIAHWPAQIAAGSTSDSLVSLADCFATIADITGQNVAENEGEDSISFLPLLQGAAQGTRTSAVYHSQGGTFALRNENWVFIDAPTGAENEEPEWYRQERGYTAHDFPGELFDLGDDPQERLNRYGDEPALVASMKAELEVVKAGMAPDGPGPHEGELPA